MAETPIDPEFRKRFWEQEVPRPGDNRDDYQRDLARILHSAAFRRLQAKTQVMGIGEGDFHRTRLTHSIEAGQVGEGLLRRLSAHHADDADIMRWLPSSDLVRTACYAHDLGHPPFGHGGEQALHGRMAEAGGFEGNGQTLRILTRLEKYRLHQGANPTRRLLLAVLKYPIPYSRFDLEAHRTKPPKCYFDTEEDIIDWALSEPFAPGERELLSHTFEKGKPKHRTLDATLAECADDIAYGVHDLEDIVARRLVQEVDVMDCLKKVFEDAGQRIGSVQDSIRLDDVRRGLFDGNSADRKETIGRLVNLFISAAEIREEANFVHPLVRYRVVLPGPEQALLEALKRITYDLVIQGAEIQQLERRGQRIVEALFDELIGDPERLIPEDAWKSLGKSDTKERRVCDYIAGMTDNYAEKIYRRLFLPGFGSSRDDL